MSYNTESYETYFTTNGSNKELHIYIEFDIADEVVRYLNEEAEKKARKQYIDYASCRWLTKDDVASAVDKAMTALYFNNYFLSVNDIDGSARVNYMYIDLDWILARFYYQLDVNPLNANRPGEPLNLEVTIRDPHIDRTSLLNFLRRETKRIHDRLFYASQWEKEEFNYKRDYQERLDKKAVRKKKAPITTIVISIPVLALALYLSILLGIKKGVLSGIGMCGCVICFAVFLFYLLRKLFKKEDFAITMVIHEEVPFAKGLFTAMIPIYALTAGFFFISMAVSHVGSGFGVILLQMAALMISLFVMGIATGIVALICVAGRDIYRKNHKR